MPKRGEYGRTYTKVRHLCGHEKRYRTDRIANMQDGHPGVPCLNCRIVAAKATQQPTETQPQPSPVASA